MEGNNLFAAYKQNTDTDIVAHYQKGDDHRQSQQYKGLEAR